MSTQIKVLLLQQDYNVRPRNFADLNEQIVLALPPERYAVFSGFLSGAPEPGDPLSKAAHSVYFGFDVAGLRVRALWRLYKYCRHEAFDVVICNRFKAVNMMLIVSRLLRRPPSCIGISHGYGEYDRRGRRLRLKLLVRENWRFVGVSSAVRDYLLGCHCGFTERNTVAINNAIDADQAVALQRPRQEARELLGLPQDALIIGAVGRLVPVKGHAALIRAFARIADEFPAARLAIIGGGRAEESLKDEISRLNMRHRIDLLGARDVTLQYIRAFDIFAMPSFSEGLPLALLEAMSAALPIIGSDIPAMRDMVIGAGGELVRPGNENDLQKALMRVCSWSHAERQARAQVVRQYFLSNHDIHQYRLQYRSLVETMLSLASRDRS